MIEEEADLQDERLSRNSVGHRRISQRIAHNDDMVSFLHVLVIVGALQCVFVFVESVNQPLLKSIRNVVLGELQEVGHDFDVGEINVGLAH